MILIVSYSNRQTGQNTKEELNRKNYKRELEEKEKIAYEEKVEKNRSYRHSSTSNLAITNTEESQKLTLPSTKKIKSEHIPLDIDADDPVYLSDEDNEDKLKHSDSESDEDSEEDDTADLLAELNNLKKERAIEDAKREAEQKAKEERIRIENILHGNPLNNKSEFKVKRRWDDDVVFKNCSRGEDNKDKGFINDTLRSEFHKKFMEKYIK